MAVKESTAHPAPEKVRAFGQGHLATDEALALEQHLLGCAECCLLLEELPSDSFLGRLREVGDLPVTDTQVMEADSVQHEEHGELANHPRYRVIRLLGKGGMGAVYLAEHRRMGRPVALKVISPELLNHAGALARFQQEVRAAAKLDHPNIVAAYDADQADIWHFLVMEYVEGQNLADYLIEREPLAMAKACDVIRQAALGLQHAHARGMVHRDIKPHNLMLTPAGQVKVLDFGLARFAAEPAGATTGHKGPGAPHLTGAGTVMGTADYIAPEQARDAHRADGRADIYSLGCSLYHLLTNRPPFPEGTAEEKLQRHAAEEPCRVDALRPETPEGLAQVVARMMAKKPEDRYQTAAEVAQALTPYAAGGLPKRSTVRRALFAGAGLALLLVSLTAAAGVVRLPVGQDREIVIETDDPSIEVIVKGERIVRIVDPKTGKAYRLDRDELTLSLADGPEGLAVTLDETEPIVLRRQGQRIATVRLEQRRSKHEEERAEPAALTTRGGKRFERLFNGKDLTGWVVDGSSAGSWHVRDGQLVAKGSRLASSYLLTEKSYAEFVLRLEFQLATAANSGVALRAVPGERDAGDTTVPQHLEVQIRDDDTALEKYGAKTNVTGSLYWARGGSYLRPDQRASLRPAGNWNEMTIESRGGFLQVWVNGRQLLNSDLQQLGHQADALPGVQRLAGRIGLQQHTGEVRFRHIEIAELTAEKKSSPQEFLDPAGWRGLPGYWRVKDRSIIGAPANGVPAHTFLCSQQTYKDFELTFKVRRKHGIGNSGVQFRSTLADPLRFTVAGPQLEIDAATFRLSPGSIVTEPTGKPFVKSNAAAVAEVWRDADFNDMTLRCVGQHVHVTVNGVVALDADFPSMPDEGIIAWQLHGGGFPGLSSPEEVVFKDIQFTDLSNLGVDGFVRLFNGKDMTGWKTHPKTPGNWQVEDGVLVGRGPMKSCLYSARGDYEDLHFRVETMINEWGNSGQQFRKAFSPGLFGDGYEAQIDCGYHEAKTGSLFIQGGTAAVKIKEVLVPANTWFTQEVIARGNHIHILVNGTEVVNYVDNDRTWRRGHLALQLFEPETVVRFRRIEVKELTRHDEVRTKQPLPDQAPARAKQTHRLFNGKDLTGWIVDGGSPNAWRVVNGELVGTGIGFLQSGFLLSERPYSNFRLQFEFQLAEGANSGVGLRAVPGERLEKGQGPPHPLEVQIGDDEKFRRPDGTIPNPTGGLFWSRHDSYLHPDRLADLKPLGSWNQMEIEARGDSLRVWVNGRQVLQTDLDRLAKRPVARASLNRLRGHIGFQQHTGEVRFRNILIEELPAAAIERPISSTSGYRGIPTALPQVLPAPVPNFGQPLRPPTGVC